MTSNSNEIICLLSELFFIFLLIYNLSIIEFFSRLLVSTIRVAPEADIGGRARSNFCDVRVSVHVRGFTICDVRIHVRVRGHKFPCPPISGLKCLGPELQWPSMSELRLREYQIVPSYNCCNRILIE